jgi:hypothetical protein
MSWPSGRGKVHTKRHEGPTEVPMLLDALAERVISPRPKIGLWRLRAPVAFRAISSALRVNRFPRCLIRSARMRPP